MRKKSDNIIALCSLITQIKEYIKDDSDMIWCGYEDVKQLRRELQEYEVRLKNNDCDCLSDLDLLFAPTGALQEHSLSNEWSEVYLKLAVDYDKLSNTIKKSGK